MQQFTVIPNQLLARTDTSLGRLVLDTENPERTFHISKNLQLAKEDISEKVDTDYQGLEKIASESSLKAYFTRLLSLTGHKDDVGQTQLDSSRVVTYKLFNSDDKFSEMCLGEDAGTKVWIQNAIKKGRRVYMVTGLKCVTDAQVQSAHHESRGASGKAEVPVGAITGVPTNKANAGVEASTSSSKAQELGFVATGEQIYAVQYRQLKFRDYLRKDVENAALENRVRWSLYLKRSAGEEEEVVEVSLSSEADAAELPSLSSSKVAGEDVFLSSKLFS